MIAISQAKKVLGEVEYRIKMAKDQCQRQDDVQLVAVSKGVLPETMYSFYTAGVRNFGENYIQEWLSKKSTLPADITWHVIGHVQRNKSRWVAQEADWLHTLDSIPLANRLEDQRPPHLPALQVCIEVNVSGAPQKSGVALNEIAPLIDHVLSLNNLQLRGLMCLPSPIHCIQVKEEMQRIQEFFQVLKKQIKTVDTLSMGMSSDLELSIAHGATLVRIGTALFGERN